MVDDETQDVSARPAGAPPNRDARPDPGVIDGEIAARGPVILRDCPRNWFVSADISCRLCECECGFITIQKSHR